MKPKKTDEEGEGFEDEADDTPEIDDAAVAEPLESDDDSDDETPGEAGGGEAGVGFEEDEGDDLSEEGDDGVPFIEDEEDDFAEDDIEVSGDDDEES